MLKTDAEAQLEGANNRLGEVRCYDLRNSFFAVALNFGKVSSLLRQCYAIVGLAVTS